MITLHLTDREAETVACAIYAHRVHLMHKMIDFEHTSDFGRRLLGLQVEELRILLADINMQLYERLKPNDQGNLFEFGD